MIGAIETSSSGWEKTKFVFQVERACEERGVFFVYLSSQHILKINPQEQGSVNAFAIFIFSTQFNSGTDQSDKQKNTKVHLKKFNYTLGLTLQTFKTS